MGFYGSNDPTNSGVKALKEDRSKGLGSFPADPPHHAHKNTTMRYETKTHKIHTDKHSN